MKQLAILLLIVNCLSLYGCGEEEPAGPAASEDTTPPTIVGTSVQGGPIPVNTSIVIIFSERVDLTSAQRGISVRSSIDAEPVKGVVTLQKGGFEAKFIPTENMTSGGYVLTAIGIEDEAGNILMTPVSIFFGAVQADTTKPPADVVPPKIVSSTPGEGQLANPTDSLVVRFDEEIDASSAQAGIVVSGAEGTVDVTGVVAIFTPDKPMQAGNHNLAIVGVKDLTGNVMDPSIIIPFEVIAPPPDVVVPPNTGQPSEGKTLFKVSAFGGAHQVWFEAEDYDVRDPDTDEFYPVVDADGAFGQAITRVNAPGGMISWTFDISAAGGGGGTWYFWYRGINPSNSSDYMLVEGDPGDPDIPAGPPYPGSDGTAPFDNGDDRIFEEDMGPPFAWGRAGHEEGHTKELRNGMNTMYIFHRQGNDTVFWDVFMWTDSPDYVPTDDDYNNAEVSGGAAAEPFDKLSTTWGSIKKRL